jgi:excisionase family DNA binding protein
MAPFESYLTVKEAAAELGLSAGALRSAINYGSLHAVRLDERTNLIHRDEVERYRREHKGRRGKRKEQPARYEDVRRLYRQHYKGGRGRTARWDEGWSVQRVAQETGFSVSHVYAIVSHKEQPATTEPPE